MTLRYSPPPSQMNIPSAITEYEMEMLHNVHVSYICAAVWTLKTKLQFMFQSSGVATHDNSRTAPQPDGLK